MEKINIDALRTILREDGSYARFTKKLKENEEMFPDQCSGNIRYWVAFELTELKVHISCRVQIIFKEEKRYSRIIETRVLDLDEYINLCTSCDDEFRKTYIKLINSINNSKN